MKKEESLLLDFLWSLPVDTYPKLFKQTEVAADIFSHIVKVLGAWETDVDRAALIIFNLCKTKSIDLTLMMLEDEEKKVILDIVHKFEEASSLPDKDSICETIRNMVD